MKYSRLIRANFSTKFHAILQIDRTHNVNYISPLGLVFDRVFSLSKVNETETTGNLREIGSFKACGLLESYTLYFFKLSLLTR